jgi:hypothetical protein
LGGINRKAQQAVAGETFCFRPYQSLRDQSGVCLADATALQRGGREFFGFAERQYRHFTRSFSPRLRGEWIAAP